GRRSVTQLLGVLLDPPRRAGFVRAVRPTVGARRSVRRPLPAAPAAPVLRAPGLPAVAVTRASSAAGGRLRTADGLGDLVHADPQATGHEPFVPGPQRSIADGGHDGGRSAHRPDAPLRGREVEAG